MQDARAANVERSDASTGADSRAAASRSLWHLLLGVVGGVTAAWVLVLLLWDEAPFTLTFDDAYYYLGIARNLVDGHGSTFDQINLTNGYHPLWLLVSTVPFAAGLDDLAAARVLLIVQLVVGSPIGPRT